MLLSMFRVMIRVVVRVRVSMGRLTLILILSMKCNEHHPTL